MSSLFVLILFRNGRAIFPPIIGFGTYWTPLNPILYGPYSMGHTIDHTDHMIWWGYSKWSSKVFQKQFTVLWGNGSNCLILSALILKMLKILIFNMLCNIRVTKFLHTIQDYYNEEGWIYFFGLEYIRRHELWRAVTGRSLFRDL